MKRQVLLLVLLCAFSAAQTHVLTPGQGGTGNANTVGIKMGSVAWDLSTYGGGVPTISGAGAGAVTQATAHGLAAPLSCADTSGSGTVQSCSTSPTYTPAAGDWIIYSTTTANGGDVTLNVNSAGAKHIRKNLGAATLASGDLAANVPVMLVYDGTYWEIPTIGNSSSGGIGSITLPSDLFTGSPCTVSPCVFGKQNQNSGYGLFADPTNIYNPFIVQWAVGTSTTVGLHGAVTGTFAGPTAAGNSLSEWGQGSGTTNGTETFTETGASDTFTTIDTNESANSPERLSYAKNISGGATAVINTLSGDSCGGACTLAVSSVEVTNVDTSSPLDVGVRGSGDVTTTNAHDIIVSLCYRGAGARTAVAPWTQFGGAKTWRAGFVSLEYLVTNATGTFTPAWSGSCDSQASTAFKAAFNASATWQMQPIAFHFLTLSAFPGLGATDPSSAAGDTQINLHVGKHIIAHDTTSAYAGNDAASTLAATPSGTATGYSCSIYVKCQSAVSTATVIPHLLFTSDDGSSTAEDITGPTATCTTLGSSDLAFILQPIHAKASTTIYAKTVLANTPHYNIDAFCSLTTTQ